MTDRLTPPLIWDNQRDRTTRLMAISLYPRSGKTVAVAGLAANLAQGGLSVDVVKPYWRQPEGVVADKPDVTFIEQVADITPKSQPLIYQSPHQLKAIDWQRIIQQCQPPVNPLLIDTDGGMADAIYIDDKTGKYYDALDLAEALNVPVLLVLPKSQRLIGDMALAMSSLSQCAVPLFGWLAVETNQVFAADWDVDAQQLSYQYGTHYLGLIDFDTSISVETIRIGNLPEQCGQGIDLLPFQQCLGALVP